MSKIFQKFKNHKYRNLICVLGLVLVFAVLPSKVLAYSGEDAFNWILFNIGSFFGVLVAFLIGFLMRVAAYNDFTTLEIVRTGWKLTRDVCNMFFIVILMVIAVCTIIRVEAYNYKKMLPALLIKAVLINFSLLFCGLLIDASQVVTLTFVNAFKDAGKGNFITGLGLKDIYRFSTIGSPSTGTTFTLLFGAIMLAIAVVVIGALVVVFLGRMIAFWILIVLSPFAFLASASGGLGSKYSEQWWSEFTKYLIVGPVLAFFLWLSLYMMRQTMLDSITSKMRIEATPSIGESEAGVPSTFFAFLISTAMLLGSLVAAQQIGTAGSGAAGKALGGLKAAGAFVAKGVPSYANELLALGSEKLTGGKFSLNLNAMDYINAWKEAREDKHHKRLEKSRGTIRDYAEYGYASAAGNQIFRRGVGVREFRAKKALERKQKEQKLDEYRLEFGGEANAAGKKRLEEMTADRDKLVANLKDNRNELQSHTNKKALLIKQFEENATEFGMKSIITDPYGNKISQWVDKEGKIINKEKLEKEFKDAETTYLSQITDLEKKLEELDRNMKGADAVSLTSKIVEEEKEARNSKLREADSVEGGKIDLNETNNRLSEIISELKALEEKKPVDLSPFEKERMETLKIKKADLNNYKDSITNGVPLGAIKNEELITSNKDKKTIKKEVEALKKEAESHKDKADIIRETASATYVPKFTLEEKQKEMADRKKEIEEIEEKRMRMSGPDKFYRESARRAMVAEEQKKIADVKESSELVSLLKKTQHEGDFYKFSAILKQLAGNADDNEALNGFGYMSNFQGMKDFFGKEIIGKMHVDEQRALALANDIAYINEGRNHWETARVAKNDNGEWRWNTEREHTQASLAELMKKNDRELAQKLNRLAYGGEKQNADGSRTFQFSNLGKALMYNLGQNFEYLFMNRREGTSNLLFNIKGDRAFIDELRRNSAITESFYNFIYRPERGKKPAEWYDYVTRSGR